MAGIALEAEAGHADIVSEEESVSTCGGVAACEAGGVSAIQVLIWVRLVSDGVDEVAIGVHVIGCESGSSHQAGKRDVEVGEIGAVTAPVEGVEAVQAAKRLGGHRT